MASTKSFVYKIRAEYEGQGEIKALSADLKKISQIKTFQGLEESFVETNKKFVEAKKKVRELRREMKKPGGEDLARSYKKARAELSRLNTSLTKQRENLNKSRVALKGQAVDLAKISTEHKKLATAVKSRGAVIAARQKLEARSWKEIKSEIKGLERAYKSLEASGELSMRELGAAKDKLRQKTVRLNREMAGGQKVYSKSAAAMGKMRTAAAGLAVIFAGVSGAGFAKAIWDAGISSEQLALSFEAIYKDSGKAAKELEWLREVADELGVDFKTLAESYRGVAASSKGTILEGQKTRQIFVGVAEASRALGLTTDSTAGALNAVAQMMSKGKIQAEELRGQLGERLYGAFQLAAEAAGVTTEQLNDMLDRGEVGIEILGEFARVLHREFGPAAREMSEGAQASFNRLTTAWYDFKVALAENGFLDKAQQAIERLTTALKDPDVQQAALNLMRLFLGFSEAAIRTGTAVNAVWSMISGHLRTVLAGITKVASGLALVTDATGLTQGAYEKLKAASSDLWDGAKAQFKEAASGIKTAALGFEEYGDKAKKAGSVVDDTFKKNKVSAAASASAQKQATEKALGDMKTAYKKYADTVKRLQDQIADNEKSLAAELREMSRSGMSDIGAWKDRKAEAEEYETAARKAMKAGDFETAVEMAKKAKAAYADLNEEVKISTRELIAQKQAQAKAMLDSGWRKGSYREYLALQKEIAALQVKQNQDAKKGIESQVVAISKAEGQKTAMDGVADSGQLVNEILKKQEQAAIKSGKALDEQSGGKLAEELPQIAKAFAEVGDQATELAEKAKDFDDAWNNAWDRAVYGGKEAMALLEQELTDLTRDRHINIYVKEITQKASGGAIGRSLSMAAGGPVGPPMSMAAGGPVNFRNMLSGGYFPGFGGGDRRHVVAEDGEVMIKKESVRMAGLKAALAFNAGRFDIVVRELTKRFDFSGFIRRQMGGEINFMPPLPPLPALQMAAGGQVSSAATAASDPIRHEHTIRTMDGRRATVFADDLNSERLIGILENALEMSS